jgi:hypothetical protein
VDAINENDTVTMKFENSKVYTERIEKIKNKVSTL